MCSGTAESIGELVIEFLADKVDTGAKAVAATTSGKGTAGVAAVACSSFRNFAGSRSPSIEVSMSQAQPWQFII